MRNQETSRHRLRTWQANKEQGRARYSEANYEGAITSYATALNPDLRCPLNERQIILSNIVACRLKIGGTPQARTAVENAKQCIAINERWAKGHVRLASAYIALGGHSNDACNELQRALSIDPGNPSARQMLIRELRRDTRYQSAGNDPMSADEATSQQTTQDHPPHDDVPIDIDADIDPSPYDRIRCFVDKVRARYDAQSDDMKLVMKVVLVLFALYIGFGGRFGLESRHENRGNYGSGNIYERYSSRDHQNGYDMYREHKREHQQAQHEGAYASSSRRRDDSHYESRGNGYAHSSRESASYGTSRSFHLPNLLDGSFQSMVILLPIMYLCHRNGINPFQIMFFLNMMGGRRRGGFRRAGGFGGGFGFGGFGGGFGRNRFGR